MDFMANELFDGRRLRLLTIVDNFGRVSPFIGVGFRYRGYDVVASLNLAVAQYGVPERLQVDNGPDPLPQYCHPGNFHIFHPKPVAVSFSFPVISVITA
jgi:hypothetical protein